MVYRKQYESKIIQVKLKIKGEPRYSKEMQEKNMVLPIAKNRPSKANEKESKQAGVMIFFLRNQRIQAKNENQKQDKEN